MGMIGNFLSVDAIKLTSIINGEEDILDLEENAVEGDQLGYDAFDVDKAWQAIQYLLCKDIVVGELPMGYVIPMMIENALECGLDYGAFYLTIKQVKEAYDYLQTLSEDKIKQMYDFQSMVEDEVYPIIQHDDENQFYEYMHLHLLNLREFYKKAAQKGRAVIFYIM